MKTDYIFWILLTLLIAASAPPASSNATLDLSLRTETDDKRDTLYSLVNTGVKTVRTKVEHEKLCTSVTNNRKPIVREYVLAPGETVQLGKTSFRSVCRRKYTILQASYPQSE